MHKKTNIYVIVGMVLLVAMITVFLDNKVFALPADQPVAYTAPTLGNLGTSNNILTTFGEFQKNFMSNKTVSAAPLDQEVLAFKDNPASFVQTGGVKMYCNSITSHLRYTGEESAKEIWDALTPEMKDWYAKDCSQ